MMFWTRRKRIEVKKGGKPVIGIVCLWFNRGQATVGRHIRSIFDDLGYTTYILARPTKDDFVFSSHIAAEDVWDQPCVTRGSAPEIPWAEYRDWVIDNGIDVVFFDQNYQFREIGRLKKEGVTTIGRFVWESFGKHHVRAARKAFSCIYSVTKCEQERYAQWGIDSPYVPYGCHPELEPYREARENAGKRFMYVGGFMSTRKPTSSAVRAFNAVDDATLELTIKTQRPVIKSDMVVADSFADVGRSRRDNSGDMSLITQDKRIRLVEQDMSVAEYYEFFAGMDVALAPSRWEGLGLHLFEAIALGVPTISCDIPPINEVITHGEDGLLVPCKEIGTLRSGVTIYEPSVDAMRDAIRQLASPGVAARMCKTMAASRERWSWDKTKTGYHELLTAYAGAGS